MMMMKIETIKICCGWRQHVCQF